MDSQFQRPYPEVEVSGASLVAPFFGFLFLGLVFILVLLLLLVLLVLVTFFLVSFPVFLPVFFFFFFRFRPRFLRELVKIPLDVVGGDGMQRAWCRLLTSSSSKSRILDDCGMRPVSSNASNIWVCLI